ncbi:PKD domain-containing protein, partial [Zunongwangia sp. H14]|uniref:PKD domain-containing protein n=1 Tax=Zunongwangia sp. H14 TaxID=3240792 RepID=UPI0035679319
MQKTTPAKDFIKKLIIITVLGNIFLTVSQSNSKEISYDKKEEIQNLMSAYKIAGPKINVTSLEHAECITTASGKISIKISGGKAPYSYSWSGDGNFTSNTKNISNLLPGNYTVTVTDSNGDYSSETIVIEVEDNIKPTVQTQNITVELDANGQATISADAIDNGSSDNCAIDELSLDKTSFNCDDIGSNSVELSVTDVNGNSAKKSATVTIQDKIKPTVKTQNITIELDANGQATISAEEIDNGSSDNCAIDKLSLDKTGFDCDDIGSNSVELSVTDVNGNSAKKSAIVTVQDNIKPTVKIQNITIELDANGQATISADEIDNGSSDNCAIDELSLDKTSFDCDDIGSNSVELSVTDVNGNSAKK